MSERVPHVVRGENLTELEPGGVCYPVRDMNEADITTDHRTPLWASPGLIVAVIFSVLVVLIAIGVLITNRGGDVAGEVTIAELRAQPLRFDGQTVILTGTAEQVRQLPVLDQYALYTFRDESGSMWALTQHGAPPDDGSEVRLTAVYHSRITLDEEIKRIVEGQLGSLAGSVVSSILPSVAVNAVFLEHLEYQPAD